MAAPLSVCTKEEQRSVSGFCGRKVYQEPQSIKDFRHKREQCIAATECLRMDWKIKNGRTIVTHDKGAGRPSTAITENNIERARDMVLLDKRVSIDEVAHVLQISHGSDYELMHNKLGFHKICARWVPKQLSEVHKQTRVDICQKHLHL